MSHQCLACRLGMYCDSNDTQCQLPIVCAGMSKRSGLEGLAGAVLSAAMHLSGVVARSSDVLPVVGLAAGVASGSCFMQFEGERARLLGSNVPPA